MYVDTTPFAMSMRRMQLLSVSLTNMNPLYIAIAVGELNRACDRVPLTRPGVVALGAVGSVLTPLNRNVRD